jgi:hypothetical protein
MLSEEVTGFQSSEQLSASLLAYILLHDLHLTGEDDVQPYSPLSLAHDGFAGLCAAPVQHTFQLAEFPPAQILEYRHLDHEFVQRVNPLPPSPEDIAPERIQPHLCLTGKLHKGKNDPFIAKESFASRPLGGAEVGDRSTGQNSI